ncbi:kinesin [Pseudoloma neurophilia]|uniref:Kinesin n=1 Tax=Pseudoloma neurophilia TaxID=146866 RepID=A0A0R0M8K1_9MICR|nr:kinesin [Pseudoloma neurophilia]
MKKFDLKSMRYITDLQNIMNELKKSTESAIDRKKKTENFKTEIVKELRDQNKYILEMKIADLEQENECLRKHSNYLEKYFKKYNNKNIEEQERKLRKYRKKIKKNLNRKNVTFQEQFSEEIAVEGQSDEVASHSESLQSNEESETKTEEEKVHEQKKISHEIERVTLEDKVQKIEKNLNEKLETLTFSYNDLQNRYNNLKKEIVEQSEQYESQINNKNEQIRILTHNLKESEHVIDNQLEEIIFLKKQLKNSECNILLLKEQSYQLRSKVLQKQSDIQVICRIRPMGKQTFKGDGQVVNMNSNNLKIHGNKIVIKDTSFIFDQLFTDNVLQYDLFNDLSYLVHGFITGYNICLFAYGQTGSGKTYTIMGENGSDSAAIDFDGCIKSGEKDGGMGLNINKYEKDEGMRLNINKYEKDGVMGLTMHKESKRGILPRAIDYIYEHLDSSNDSMGVEVSFIEIYNECVYDMITDKEIKKDDQPFHHITDKQHLLKIVKQSNEKRRTGKTACNEQSSRSHTVYTIRLVKRDNIKDENILTELQGGELGSDEKSKVVLSNFSFIDLAGSERIKQSKVEGVRLKETQCINTSLLQLKIIINQLKNKNEHISYRNSRLTRLLKNLITDRYKLILLLNVIDMEDGETLSTLRFGQVARGVEIGEDE